MICPSCGSENSTKFCVNCGAQLQDAAPEAEVEAVAEEASAPEVGADCASEFETAPEGGVAETANAAPEPEPSPAWSAAEGSAGGSGFSGGSSSPDGFAPNDNPYGHQRATAQPVTPPMYDASRRSEGILKQAWEDVCKDPGFVKTMLLLALVSMVPILNFVSLGYSLKWGRSAAFRTGDKMPEKIFGNGHFLLGFYVVVVLVVWIIAMCLIGVMLPFISWIPLLLAVPFLELAIMYVAMVNEIGAGFRLKKIWAAGKCNYGGLLLIILVPVLISFCFTFFCGGIADLLGSNAAYIFSMTPYGNVHVSYWSAYDTVLTLGLGYVNALVGIVTGLFGNRALGYWIGRMAPQLVVESVDKGEAPE